MTTKAGRLDCALVWLRRDLRIYDNPALICALQCSKSVIPIYIHAPEEEGQFQLGRSALWWLKQTLRHLSDDVARLGSRLIIRESRTEALPVILDLLRETGAQALFFNHLYDAISLTRDHDVKMAVECSGIICRSFNSELLYEPWEVLDENDEPFVTFMEFWNRVISMAYPPSYPLPAPRSLPPVPPHLGGLTLDQVGFFTSSVQEESVQQLEYQWEPSTSAGHERLEKFLQNVLPRYDFDRAKVDRSSTSQMSPWLHVGSVSERYVYYRVVTRHAELRAQGLDCTASCLQYLQQCGYREYSRYLSFHFPFVTERSLLAHLRACPFRLDKERYKAWKKGQTGYPLVDAAMRQLWSTGWIHNRLRVVVSSFMVKNLLLPWQWGLKHLWDTQIDADLETDALGWQYVAGCLIDGHPFSYMLDVDAESRRFDPDGTYVRRWLPALALLPDEFIHQPWNASSAMLQEAGVELGFNYPHRVVCPAESRRDVDWASGVIEACCSSGSGDSGAWNNLQARGSGGDGTADGGSTGGGSSGDGAMGDAVNNLVGAAVASGQTGEHGGVGAGVGREAEDEAGFDPRWVAGLEGLSDSSGQQVTPLGKKNAEMLAGRQPRKQPYKPPSDPVVQAAFLRAVSQGKVSLRIVNGVVVGSPLGGVGMEEGGAENALCGPGAGVGKNGGSSNYGRCVLDVLRATEPDLAALQPPENVYLRNPALDQALDHGTRQYSRRYGQAASSSRSRSRPLPSHPHKAPVAAATAPPAPARPCRGGAGDATGGRGDAGGPPGMDDGSGESGSAVWNNAGVGSGDKEGARLDVSEGVCSNATTSEQEDGCSNGFVSVASRRY